MISDEWCAMGWYFLRIDNPHAEIRGGFRLPQLVTDLPAAIRLDWSTTHDEKDDRWLNTPYVKQGQCQYLAGSRNIQNPPPKITDTYTDVHLLKYDLHG